MDVEKIKALINQLPWSVLLLGYLAYAGWDFYSFEYDDASERQLATGKLKKAEEDTKKLQEKVITLEKFEASLETRRVEVRDFARSLQDLKTSISENSDDSAFVKTLYLEAKRAGINIKSINPVGLVKEEFYSKHSFDFKITGIFSQIDNFLDRMANLTQIVRADNFSLKSKTEPSGGRFQILDGVIQLSTFTYNGSKADTLGEAVDPAKNSAGAASTLPGASASPGPQTPQQQSPPPPSSSAAAAAPTPAGAKP